MDILYYFTPEDSRNMTYTGINCNLCIKLKSALKSIFWVAVAISLVVLLGR